MSRVGDRSNCDTYGSDEEGSLKKGDDKGGFSRGDDRQGGFDGRRYEIFNVTSL